MASSIFIPLRSTSRSSGTARHDLGAQTGAALRFAFADLRRPWGRAVRRGAGVGNGPMIAAGVVALAVGAALATRHRDRRGPASCSATCGGASCGGADCGGD